jgi:thimet oligopeptidase
MKMMQTRYEIATLLGYSSWADYYAADKMAVNGQNIANFIRDLDAAARPLAQREFAMLLAEKQKTEPGAKEIWEYESSYIKEQLRRSQFNFDSQSVRPYLPYPSVKKGIMDTAAQLFQCDFCAEQNVPAWDPTVETWESWTREDGRAFLSTAPARASSAMPKWCRCLMASAESRCRKLRWSAIFPRRRRLCRQWVWRRADFFQNLVPDAPHSG